jgi:hypothetical protein
VRVCFALSTPSKAADEVEKADLSESVVFFDTFSSILKKVF